ncbi:MAG: hypothetical protein ACI9JM_002506 [Halioglobus sp.]|jgi:hypothetical protein
MDLDEDFIDVASIAKATLLAFQSSSIQSTKLDAPEPDRFSADGDASFSE